MKSYTDATKITSFTSDTTSFFSFATSSHELWFGDLGVNDIVPIHAANNASVHYYPFFSLTGVYQELVLTGGAGNTVSFFKRTVDINSILANNENILQVRLKVLFVDFREPVLTV